MFKKILIAEDIDSINKSVIQALTELGVTTIAHAQYCDDALLKVKKSLLDNEPYELLISDLSFQSDHRAVTIDSGDELIQCIKAIQPNIKVLVYSIEDKSYRIKSLFEVQKIDGYVQKGRKSIEQLKTAVSTILKGENYLAPEMQHLMQDKTVHEIDTYDIMLMKHLSEGISQDEMESKFKDMGIAPNSKSTIEKRINKLKIYFRANNTTHLIAIAKDLGVV